MKKLTKFFMFSMTLLFMLAVIFTSCEHASNPISPSTPEQNEPSSTNSPEPTTPSTPGQNSSGSFTITKTSNITNGTIEIDKTTAPAGETITITASPNSGYILKTITVTCDNSTPVTVNGTGIVRTFTMPAHNVTINASFSLPTFPVTIAECVNGSFSVDKNEASENQIVRVNAIPNPYYELDTINITDAEGNTILLDSSNMFTMPACTVTVSGTFKIIPPLKSSSDIKNILRNNLRAGSTAIKFVHSETAPGNGVNTYRLSKDDDSVLDVSAWLDGTTIYFYAQGFTDSNRKIPLNADSSYFFYECSSLKEIDLSYFDTSNVTNMDSMFSDCNALTSLDLSSFDTSNVTDMSGMFSSCYALTSLDLSNFDTSNVTNMCYMFYGCYSLASLDLSGFNTANVTDMSTMFGSCNALTSLDLSNFDTSNVTDMRGLISSCSKLTSLNLSSFDTSNVTDMYCMFEGCSALETVYASNTFDVSSVTTSRDMFTGCSSLKGGAGTVYDNSHEDKEYARIDNPPDAPGYFTLKLQN